MRFLSSDLLEGRGVGTRGGQLTEEYIAAQLAGRASNRPATTERISKKCRWSGCNTLPESRLSATKGGKTIDFSWQDEFVGATHRQQTEVKLSRPRPSSSVTASSTSRRNGTTTKAWT